MTYDHNGNIKSLTRKQRKYDDLSGLYTNETIDNLTYAYKNTDKNSLEKITDDASLAAGFDNGNSSTNNDYTYDINGNLTSDKNKGIDSIYYNFLGKPVRMDFTDGKKIEYVYDAGGNKLTQKLYHGDTLKTTTHYVNGFVYEAIAGGSPTLSFFGSPEGRVVNNSGTLEYQYSIADHQGNIRVVFTSEVPATEAAIADFEASTNNEFMNYPSGASRSSLALFNHTASGTYSQKLTGGNNSQIGVAKAMKVYPGDKVKIEAYAKYYNPSGTTSNITGFALALTGAFGVTSSSTGEALKAYNTLNNYGGIIAGGGSGGSSEHPKLFVNILLFDKDYNFLDAAWEQIDGGEQVGATPKAAHALMSKEVIVKEAGYAYVFVSNESPTLVEFYVDDVTITHTPTNVIQYNEYYPFGLQVNTSWTRENTKDNNYLYNAANELNKTNGWYEMFYRGYDPAIGRMLQVDPYAPMYASTTTYNYALNNPVMMNDPNGGQVSYGNPDGISDVAQQRMYKLYVNHGFGSYSGWADSYNVMEGGGQVLSAQYTAAAMRDLAYNLKYGYNIGPGSILSEKNGIVTYMYQTGQNYVQVDKAGNPIDGTETGTVYFNYAEIDLTQGNDPSRSKNPYAGHSVSLNGGLALGGGINASIGIVWNKDGDWRFFASWGPSVGVDASIGFNSKDIKTRTGTFDPNQYGGWGSSHNVGFFFFDGIIIGGDNDPQFSTGRMGATYVESGAGLSIGLPAAYTYQMSYTVFPGDWFK